MTAELCEPACLPARDAEQKRRALLLLDTANQQENPDLQFVKRVGALHLVRAIPEYWYTTSQQIPGEINVTGKDADDLKRRLAEQFESAFRKARRYGLITDLRRWDFHWEPLIDARTIAPNMAYGRGAPMKLTTGTQPGSTVGYVGGVGVVATGSGRRVGRSNYYQIQKCRYVDPDRPEALPLDLALREFLEDLPSCVAEIMAIPEVDRFIRAQQQ